MFRSTYSKIRKIPPFEKQIVRNTKLDFLLGVIAFPGVNTRATPRSLVSHFHKPATCFFADAQHPHQTLNLCKSLRSGVGKGCCAVEVNRWSGSRDCMPSRATELAMLRTELER